MKINYRHDSNSSLNQSKKEILKNTIVESGIVDTFSFEQTARCGKLTPPKRRLSIEAGQQYFWRDHKDRLRSTLIVLVCDRSICKSHKQHEAPVHIFPVMGQRKLTLNMSIKKHWNSKRGISLRSCYFVPSEITLQIPKVLKPIAQLPKLELVELYDAFQQDETNGTQNNYKLMQYMISNSERLRSMLGQSYSSSLENKVSDFLGAVSGLSMTLNVTIVSKQPNKPTIMKLLCPVYTNSEYDTYLTKFQQTRRNMTLMSKKQK